MAARRPPKPKPELMGDILSQDEIDALLSATEADCEDRLPDLRPPRPSLFPSRCRLGSGIIMVEGRAYYSAGGSLWHPLKPELKEKR